MHTKGHKELMESATNENDFVLLPPSLIALIYATNQKSMRIHPCPRFAEILRGQAPLDQGRTGAI